MREHGSAQEIVVRIDKILVEPRQHERHYEQYVEIPRGYTRPETHVLGARENGTWL